MPYRGDVSWKPRRRGGRPVGTAIVVLTLATGIACATRSGATRGEPPAAACPSAEAASPDQTDGARPFDLAANADFAGYERAVRNFAARTSPGQAEDYCVVGFASGTDWRLAWVLGGGHIAVWSGGDAEVGQPRDLDLSTDVVASESDLHGSTYLVTREWVDRLTTGCRCFGHPVSTKPNAGKRKD